MQYQFMHRALELAKKGIGHTSPNPAVGAVIVKDGSIIGEGWHKKAGGSHAEVAAVRSVKDTQDIVGSTLYVTLEPCCHFGKTPPCTDLILSHGFTEVVVGMKDCFQKVNGEGITLLNKKGVRVTILPDTDSLAKDIAAINQPFLKWASVGLPYVTMKAATTLDGKIATRKGLSEWITGEDTRRDARMERSVADAVLVGAGTVRADDPELAAHGAYRKKKIFRVIIDTTLSLDPAAYRVFRDNSVLVVHTTKAPKTRRRMYEKKEIPCYSSGPDMSVKRLLQYLGKQYIMHLFVEGGAGVHGMFHDAALKNPMAIDRVVWYVAPRLFGGSTALAAVGGDGVGKPDDAISLSHITSDRIGNDIKITGLVNVYL